FDDVRDELRAELGVDRAARLISDLLSDIDDRLAAGATVEDLANETDMVLGDIAYFTGQDADIAAYPAFRAAASAVQEGDFPEIQELENGGIFALRLDEITAPRLRPLDEVRADVIAAWQAAETTAALTAKADDIAAAANSGAPLSDFGTVETAEPAERGAVAPLILSETVFALNAGETGVYADGDLVYVVTLDEILPPADDADTQDMLATLRTATADSIGRDVFVYFSQDLLNTAGLTLDQAAINAVHAQFP
ncbi:MAG: peptidylprolyl isomerase, partial [Pseudomonadota bacterium]|nr:peptidylprolyl isomerase [Pseudomonadota bacterium]